MIRPLKLGDIPRILELHPQWTREKLVETGTYAFVAVCDPEIEDCAILKHEDGKIVVYEMAVNAELLEAIYNHAKRSEIIRNDVSFVVNYEEKALMAFLVSKGFSSKAKGDMVAFSIQEKLRAL